MRRSTQSAIAVGIGASVGALTYLSGPELQAGRERNMDAALVACESQLTDDYQSLETLPRSCYDFSDKYNDLTGNTNPQLPFSWTHAQVTGPETDPVIEPAKYQVPPASVLDEAYFIPNDEIDADEGLGLAVAATIGGTVIVGLKSAMEIERRTIVSPRARRLVTEAQIYLQLGEDERQRRWPPAA